jgi:hypothetical protein
MNEVREKIYLVQYPSILADRNLLHAFSRDYSRMEKGA